MKALLNPATGVVFSWTQELAKRGDLVEVTVNQNYEIIKEDVKNDEIPFVVERMQDPVIEKPRKGKKRKLSDEGF